MKGIKAKSWFALCLVFVSMLTTGSGVLFAATDVTEKVQLNKDRMLFDRRTSENYFKASVTNTSSDILQAPFHIIINNISSASVTVANPDGNTTDSMPYFEYASGSFYPGETTAAKKWVFANPDRVRFTFTYKAVDSSVAFIDDDGDGVSPEQGDCDDNNPNVYPNATETCDSIDNNCNDQIDEGVTNACGFCGSVPDEICDGLDNDCDGQVDEENVCDSCPDDPDKTEPGICGCAIPDTDTDNDEVADCLDTCPDTLPGDSVDAKGCSESQNIALTVPLVNFTPGIVFSSLLERGSNADCMAFNTDGDLYFYGWKHGLEKVAADQLPDGAHQLLLDKTDYSSFFNDASLSEVLNITGFGIGFDSRERVLSYIKGVYRQVDSDEDKIKIGFVSCESDGSFLDPLELIAGEDFIGLKRVRMAEGGYEELDVLQGEVFDVGDRDPLQMKVVDLDGNETILFTLWGLPVIFQVSPLGGEVISFYNFADGYPREMTLMGDDLIVTHSDSNIYRISLVNRTKSDFVSKSQLMDFFGVESGNICFVELDYEPLSNKIYAVAQICWNNDIPQTMLAITPDGSTLTKILDENSLTEDLAVIRTSPEGKNLKIQAVAVNPVAIAAGKASLFLGDYWSGLELVRMDLFSNRYQIHKNLPTGARVDLNFGSGDNILCFAPFGRLEGSFHANTFLPEGENYIQVVRNGMPEEYIVDIIPAFTLTAMTNAGDVSLSWSHLPGTTRYDIFRASAAEPEKFIKIAGTVSTDSTCLDTRATTNETYIYAVAAAYAEYREFSNVIAATPSLSPQPGNIAPLIYSGTPPDEVWTNTTFTYRVLAVDPDGDILTYSLSGAPVGMAIDADGLISWTPDASQVGTVTFIVTVTDENGAAVSLDVSLNVYSPPVPTVYSIQGHVIALNMSIPGPLSGIKVSVGNQDVWTDDNGYFQITGLAEPVFKLLVDGWNRERNRYAFMHYDVEIPEDQNEITQQVYLPLIGSTNISTIDEKIADMEIQADGSTQATLKTDFVLHADKDGFNASLLIKKGTILSFPPDFDPVISLNYLGPQLFPVSMPVDPATENVLYTLNLFTIQPEVVTFSESPEFLFDDHDNLPVGTSLRIYRYGSWNDQTPQSGIVKGNDGSIEVTEGIAEGGTYAVMPEPFSGLSDEYITTLLTGRIVVENSEEETVPVPGIEVTGMFNGGLTDADGRFSFEVLAKVPFSINAGDGRIAVQAMAFTVIDDVAYAGRASVAGMGVNPGGGTDLGDIELEKMMALISMIPGYYDANVDPEQLLGNNDTSGIQFKFSAAIDSSFTHEYANDSEVLDIVRLPMLESLYTQRLLAIPASWGEFDPFAYDCTIDEMDISLVGFNDECNDKCIDDCIKENCIKENCISGCGTDHTNCIDNDCNYDDVEDQEECLAECNTEAEECVTECNTDEEECVSVCNTDCYKARSECRDTAMFKLYDCDFGEGEFYNQWYMVFLKEMEDGITGQNDEVFFDPDLTVFDVDGLLGDKVSAALLNYNGADPRLFTMFATKENPNAEKSPLVGVLVPDENDPSGYQWHDYDTLQPDSIIDVEPGSILRIQTEDQTGMQRIVAQFGEETFNKNTMDEDEEPFLMHLDIPVPEEPIYDPIILNVTAEGFAAQFQKAVNGLDGHIKSFQVNIRIVPEDNPPTIISINSNIDIIVNQTITINIIGQHLTGVHTVTIIDPQNNETHPDFTVVNDTSITIPAYTFLSEGEHRIILTSDLGETQGIVSVEKQTSTERLDALRGTGVSYYFISGTNISERDDDSTPSPYAGRTSVSIYTELPSTNNFSRLDAQLMIPPGEAMRNSIIDILHTDAAIQGEVTLYGQKLAERAELDYREVITIMGAELADGTMIDAGVVPCHFEITGIANREGYYNVGGILAMTIAVLPDGLGINFQDPSLIDPDTGIPYEPSLSFDPETSFAQVLLKAIPPLSSAVLHLSGNPYAGTAILPEATFFPEGESLIEMVSANFDLPLGKRVIFHPGHTYVGAGDVVRRTYAVGIYCDFLNYLSGQYSYNVTFRLVSDDPDIKLIYQK